MKESLPAPITRRLEDNPGMLKLISLVVNDPRVTALAVDKDDAVTAPPTTADDALMGAAYNVTVQCGVCLIEGYTVRGI